MKQKPDDTQLADFLFEIGTMRKILRAHRQTLLTDDMTDNIATHSFRVTMIGWLLAKKEGVDPYKVMMMCFLQFVLVRWVIYSRIFHLMIWQMLLGMPIKGSHSFTHNIKIIL